nr:hypothetical protein [uncultured Flavobacterium sp.]
MKQNQSLQLFEDKKVRTLWDAEQEKWYFSIVDVILVLTESSIPKRYWTDLKKKLAKEGSQLYEGIVQLKMQSADGKYYKMDVKELLFCKSKFLYDCPQSGLNLQDTNSLKKLATNYTNFH